ncbi:response regulator [Hydrogenophaga palleronii]|uniref:response regulator n=1 Tax=Hydrogenophaga palleronii TaxID=65655 RepID=UPI000825285D|nr:response regulator [Hydrogenophaga palleronii]
MKSARSRHTILLVEDNAMDIDLTLRAFNKQRFATTIHVARDGEEALSWFERWDGGECLPAVILLDLNLPRVNGLEVLQQLKTHKKFRSIPVVVLSSSREESDLKAAYDLGVSSYIEKPVNFSQFIEVAERIELYWCVLNERPY